MQLYVFILHLLGDILDMFKKIYKQYTVYCTYTYDKLTYYTNNLYIYIVTWICVVICQFNEILYRMYKLLSNHLKAYHDYAELREALEQKKCENKKK